MVFQHSGALEIVRNWRLNSAIDTLMSSRITMRDLSSRHHERYCACLCSYHSRSLKPRLDDCGVWSLWRPLGDSSEFVHDAHRESHPVAAHEVEGSQLPDA